MNSPRLTTVPRLVLAAAAIVVIAACATQHSQSRIVRKGIEAGETYVIIRPEAELTVAERNALKNILGRYEKRLYRIQAFENGKPTKTYGAMDDRDMRVGLSAQVYRDAAAKGFTGVSLCAGQSSTNRGAVVTATDDQAGLTKSKILEGELERMFTSSTKPTVYGR